MNTDASWPTAEVAKARVLRIQTKLHQWATDDPNRRFDDLYNLVYDPAVLVDAWARVRSNRGARSAGVDGRTARHITTVVGEHGLLSELREDLKARRFSPEAVREVMIPKRGGKYRRLGIATVRDRVVQAALKTVLEPILEADFKPCSYGFRPGRRVQDAIAEIHFFTSHSYEWVVEGDIKACFDEISHVGVQDRLRARVTDKRILLLVKAFLKAGILAGRASSGTRSPARPKAGFSRRCSVTWRSRSSTIISPRPGRASLLIGRADRVGARGWPTTASSATRTTGWYSWPATAPTPRRCAIEAAAVLATMGLRLSLEKTRIAHIDEGFDFLGRHIQRHTKRGTKRQHVYTYPSKDALASIKDKVRAGTQRTSTNQSLADLRDRLNPALRGWTTHFRHDVSKANFSYLSAFLWKRTVRWLRKKHPRASLEDSSDGSTCPNGGRRRARRPCSTPARYRSPATDTGATGSPRHGPNRRRRTPQTTTERARGEPDAGGLARPVRESGPGKQSPERAATRPGSTLTRGWRPGPTRRTITQVLRIDWGTVGRIIKRVCDDELDADRLNDLYDIGIDEVSWKRQHNYLTLVANHRRGKIVWGCAGKGEKAADAFFAELDPAPAAPSAPSPPPPAPRGPASQPREARPPAIMVPFGPCPTVPAGHGIPRRVAHRRQRARPATRRARLPADRGLDGHDRRLRRVDAPPRATGRHLHRPVPRGAGAPRGAAGSRGVREPHRRAVAAAR